MRLIDADALKEAIFLMWDTPQTKLQVMKIIDSFPTVDKCSNCDLMLKEKTKRYDK